MFQSYTRLATHTLQKHSAFYHPESGLDVVNTDTPALKVFTDFMSKSPATIGPDANLDQALQEMIANKVKSLLVVDEHEDIVGLISSKQIHSSKIPALAHHHNTTVKELPVKLVMTDVDHLETLNFKELSNVRVGHIARLMHELGVHHLLVIEKPDNTAQQLVRGIFSASRISRQLGAPVVGDLSSHSIADFTRHLAPDGAR